MAPIGIRPEVTVLSVLRHLNYKPWFAIAEFIDNAVQSYSANRAALVALHGPKYKLKVTIDLDATAPGRIVITDNAAGISADDFPRAFRAAQVPVDRSGLSEFGMGMKSAACWFAQHWTVRTKALGEQVERSISFDVAHIVANKIESLEPVIRKEASSAPYTVVTLRGLHHLPKGKTLAKIKEHLASIYRMFLRDGQLELTFNDEKLAFREVPVLHAVPYVSAGVPAPTGAVVEWRKPIELDFGKGLRVSGFAALRETGSTPYAGFALFRRNRLIEGSHDETYRPSAIFKQTNSYPYQRLFGELHVEGFEVSHTKDGFRWEEYEEIFLEFLKEQVEAEPLNLIAQAENYRALPSRRDIAARATAATNSVAQHLEEDVAPKLVDVREHPPTPTPLHEALPESALKASERTVSLHDGHDEWVITLRTTVDPAGEDWISLSKADDSGVDDDPRTRRLGVDLSLAHPFSVEFLGANHENVELLLRMAAAVAISLVVTEDMSGVPPETFLYNFNNLLRGALTGRPSIASHDHNQNPKVSEAASSLGA